MTATTPPLDEAGPGAPTPDTGPAAFSPEPGATCVDVPLGRRVMVASDLLLTAEATPSSTAVSSELARALDTWDGPGILIIAGAAIASVLLAGGVGEVEHPLRGLPRPRPRALLTGASA